MDRRGPVLLLGGTGKLGSAVRRCLEPAGGLMVPSRKEYDATNLESVGSLLERIRPSVVINCVALLGIDTCEQEIEAAYRVNALLPKFLAGRSREMGFCLVQSSTDAVFSGGKGSAYTEEDPPDPINVYGMTKFMGECFVRYLAPESYVVRVSLLFGGVDARPQFVEKMLARIAAGTDSLRIATDIVLSPTYADDAARGIATILEERPPWGVYHLVNEGEASLFGFMEEVVARLGLNVRVEQGSWRDFPGAGLKNLCTPLRSVRGPLLRPWRDAVAAYCEMLRRNGMVPGGG